MRAGAKGLIPLIVDDDSSICLALGNLLGRWPALFDAAADAALALVVDMGQVRKRLRQPGARFYCK
jgi:hypothetical protein